MRLFIVFLPFSVCLLCLAAEMLRFGSVLPYPLLVASHKVCCFCLAAKLCLIFCDPVDCSPPGSSAHGIFQARTLEWGAISSSRGSSRPRDRTRVSCISCTGRQADSLPRTTWEAHYMRCDIYLYRTLVCSFSLPHLGRVTSFSKCRGGLPRPVPAPPGRGWAGTREHLPCVSA